MLRDIVFLCHPDRNANSERSRKVSAWLNNLEKRSMKNEIIRIRKDLIKDSDSLKSMDSHKKIEY